MDLLLKKSSRALSTTEDKTFGGSVEPKTRTFTAHCQMNKELLGITRYYRIQGIKHKTVFVKKKERKSNVMRFNEKQLQ